MKKHEKLALLRGIQVKVSRLRTATQDHYNAEGWDTETSRRAAQALCDEIIDMTTTARNELA